MRKCVQLREGHPDGAECAGIPQRKLRKLPIRYNYGDHYLPTSPLSNKRSGPAGARNILRNDRSQIRVGIRYFSVNHMVGGWCEGRGDVS